MTTLRCATPNCLAPADVALFASDDDHGFVNGIFCFRHAETITSTIPFAIIDKAMLVLVTAEELQHAIGEQIATKPRPP